MITERMKISSDGTGMNAALNIVDNLAVSMNLTKKQFFHLRLLAEEMFNLVRAITGGFDAYFWITEENRVCKLHLDVPKIELNYEKRRELISVSTAGENTANLGIMEKIRNIVEAGLYSIGEGYNLQAQYGTGMFAYGAVGINDTAMSDAIFAWSMQKYKSEIETRPEESEAQDELEKSIIANIADDVRVGVKKQSLEIVIEKKF
ncbi:MAG: hypothetical protein IJ597_02030 [Synergistaceae bacterium]|nr:hypothetical protein [Synergistaceae bacterium]